VSIEAEERFWAKVDRRGPDECWEWRGARNGKGYGVFRIESRSIGAHRFAFGLDAIPEGNFVCHVCDNPSCVNPAHLWTGTAKDNNRDMQAKGRLVNPKLAKTACANGHPYNEENTWITTRGWRACRVCERNRKRAEYQRTATTEAP